MDEKNEAPKAQLSDCACHMALGAVMVLLHDRIWPLGVLGFVLIAISAGKLRDSRAGFDRVQLFAGLCAACKLVTMAVSGIAVGVWIGSMLLPVLVLLLIYALRCAFGAQTAGENRISLAALIAQLLSTALALASNILALGVVGGMQISVYVAAQMASVVLEWLAIVLIVIFLLVKRRKSKEETV